MLTYVKPGQNIIQYCLLQKLLIAKNKEKHIKEEQVQVVKLIKPAMQANITRNIATAAEENQKKTKC